MKPGPQKLEKPGPIERRDLPSDPSGFCGFWTLCRRFESCDGLEFLRCCWEKQRIAEFPLPTRNHEIFPNYNFQI